MNVQVIGDPAGRLVWISPTPPGAGHEHGILDALNLAGIQVIADTAYQGGVRRAASRSGGVVWIPTPVAIGRCHTA